MQELRPEVVMILGAYPPFSADRLPAPAILAVGWLLHRAPIFRRWYLAVSEVVIRRDSVENGTQRVRLKFIIDGRGIAALIDGLYLLLDSVGPLGCPHQLVLFKAEAEGDDLQPRRSLHLGLDQ